jgi:SAM-dependent methyltransferase
MKPVDCLAIYADADLYDQEFRDRVHDLVFFRDRALASPGPVLELACGSGRLTVPIAQAGARIAGVDVSAPMLERARLRSAGAGVEVDWHLQDVRTMELGRRFALAFIATNALQHLHDLPSLQAFFERVRQHLLPGGQLILDVFNPALDKLLRPRDAAYEHKRFILDDGRQIQVQAASEYLPDAQTLNFVLTYRHEGQVIHRKDICMRCFYPQELLALCRLGGFQVLERLGDYDQQPFTAGSPKQILICRPQRT